MQHRHALANLAQFRRNGSQINLVFGLALAWPEDNAPLLRILGEVPNVTMVKESTGDIQRMHRLQQLGEGQVPFYNGCNPLALEAFVAGATGWCTAAANLIPALNQQLYQAVSDNDLERARAVFYRQLPLLDFILKGGLPATVKAGLGLTGLPVGEPRKPVFALDEAGCGRLQQLLEQMR